MIALTLVEMLMLVELSRRIRVVSTAHLVLLYILASQFCFFFADAFDYTGGNVVGIYAHVYDNELGIALYFALFGLFYAATFGLRLSDADEVYSNAISAIRAVAAYQFVLFVPLMLAIAIDAMALDMSMVLSNGQYLLLGTADALVHQNALTEFLRDLFPVVSLVVVFMFFSNLFAGRLGWAVLWLPSALWSLVFFAASASRLLAVLFFVAAILAFILLRSSRIVIVPALLGLVMFSLMMVLAGRGGGEFGLLAIPTMASSVFMGGDWSGADYVFNLFQGIFVTMDGLAVPADFTDQYRLLSLSPLPSFLDGFDAVLATDEIRLHDYVPMSAIAEVIHFGPAYMLVFFGVLAMVVRQTMLVSLSNGVMYLLFTPFVFSLFVSANAYPARNVFRQLVLVLIALVVVRLFTIRRGASQGALA